MVRVSPALNGCRWLFLCIAADTTLSPTWREESLFLDRERERARDRERERHRETDRQRERERERCGNSDPPHFRTDASCAKKKPRTRLHVNFKRGKGLDISKAGRVWTYPCWGGSIPLSKYIVWILGWTPDDRPFRNTQLLTEQPRRGCLHFCWSGWSTEAAFGAVRLEQCGHSGTLGCMRIQGCLAHKKLQPPKDHHRALGIGLL